MTKIGVWSWLKEKIAEIKKIYLSKKLMSPQLYNNDYDYYELLGIEKISEMMQGDHYYQKLLGIKKMPMLESLSNKRAREWYLYYMEKIPEVIDKNLSLQAQGMQAFQLRKWLRKKARDLMVNRKLAEELGQRDPNLTWAQIRQKQIDRGLYGELISEGIISGASRSRNETNDLLRARKPRAKEIDPLWSPFVKTPLRRDEAFEATFVSKEEYESGKLPLSEFVRLARNQKSKVNVNADLHQGLSREKEHGRNTLGLGR